MNDFNEKQAIVLNWEGKRELPEPEMPESFDSLKAESCMNKGIEMENWLEGGRRGRERDRETERMHHMVLEWGVRWEMPKDETRKT